MIKRRTLLWGLMGFAIAGCRSSSSDSFRVKFLARSIPSQILKTFNRQIPSQFEAAITLSDIYQQLQWWEAQKAPLPPLWKRFLPLRNSASTPSDEYRVKTNLVTLSDPWLDHAIQQELIQPIPEFIPAESLPEPWQRLLRRDRQGKSTAQGNDLWAVPYRTQGLMIAYQKPLFEGNNAITKWADLWRPELAGRIAMPNHPRLAISIVLKALGYSANDESVLIEDDVKEQLSALYRQVRVFDSQSHLKALVNEDVWLSVGWSGDILATLVRYRRLGAVNPQEGTVLTSDLWVAPVDAHLTDAAKAWLEFCWQPEIATQISLSSYGLSPLFFLPGATLPDKLPEQMMQLPIDSEVLLPLSPQARETLKSLLSHVDPE
ncbi:MAG: extracellular solute-binding protein [Cyanobacteria bacterium P01_D01_bin.156]